MSQQQQYSSSSSTGSTNHSSAMQRINGGVFIANNPNGLRGDIIARATCVTCTTSALSSLSSSSSLLPSDHGVKKEQLMLRWRGSQKEIPLDDHDLIEVPSSQYTDMTKEEESIRFHLTQKADDDYFYAHERLLALALGDEITFGLVTHPEQLPEEMEALFLVRTIEAFYVGQGMMVAHGRHLSSYHKALSPFGTIQKDGSLLPIPGNTIKELVENIRDIFERNFNGLLFCRAFGYAMYRLEYHKEDESILDAYCVALYAIKLLQGKLDEFMNMKFGDIVEEELVHYHSDNVDLTSDDILWCFCLLLMRISTRVRQTISIQELDDMLTTTYYTITNEELIVAKLAIEIRPESPASYLAAYGTLMDLKPLVPPPFRETWMKTAFDFATYGLQESETWGDPYFQYMFNMIMAYWMPTTTYSSHYSYKQLQERIRVANNWKAICKHEVPENLLRVGEQHEDCLHCLLAIRVFDKEAPSMPPLVRAYRYPIPSPDGIFPQLNPPSGKICHQCGKSFHTPIKCSRCGQVEYCSKICQAAHWRTIHCDECVPKTGNTCGNCGKELQKKLSCSKCGLIHYCNRKCQLAHWKTGHKKDCKLMTLLC